MLAVYGATATNGFPGRQVAPLKGFAWRPQRGRLIGGVQRGCDYQLPSGFVIGFAGDYGWTQAEGTHPSAREVGVFYQSEVQAFASVTGRLGYGFDRVLLYDDGGAPWERVDYSASTTMIGTAYRANDARSGWTVGTGAEYAFLPNWTAFIE